MGAEVWAAGKAGCCMENEAQQTPGPPDKVAMHASSRGPAQFRATYIYRQMPAMQTAVRSSVTAAANHQLHACP